MSNMLNKAKVKAEEMLHKSNADNPHSTNQGPHSSNISNKADPRVDSDRDNYGQSGLGHSGVGNTGHTGVGQPGYGSTNAGPHSSNFANSADPRVDSDRDGRGLGQGPAGTAQTHHSTTTTGSGPGYGSSNPDYVNAPGSTNAGPHNSNLMNKMDPRVDSDRDGRNDPTSRSGGYGQTQDNYGQTGYAGNTGVGSTGGHGLAAQSGVGHSGVGSTGHSGIGQPGHSTVGQSGYGSTNAGPHDSNMMNKMDPRIDSDRDNRNDPTSRVGGYGTQDNYGQTGYSQGSGLGHTSGPGHTGVGHQTGTSGYGNTGYDSSMTPGSGNADKTAGPHNSNLMNKLDPRVDSDVDGSKTMGGNKTNY